MSHPKKQGPPIAIIGVGCRLPNQKKNIETLDDFWALLNSENSPIKPFPESRWTDESFCPGIKGGFLENVDKFDAPFFRIRTEEAKEIDPQHRLFLEVAIHALNQTNISPQSLKGTNTGVFCGLSTHDYEQQTPNTVVNKHTHVGFASSGAAGRLAYHLDLRGPAYTIDTACSSSLAALQVANNALHNKECDIAIVGGIALSLLPNIFYQLTQAKMISRSAEPRCFDKSADGFVRSEGCVVIVLKRAEDAVTHRNQIHALVKSVAVKQDGRSLGLKAPSLASQVQLYHEVLEKAALTPKDIDYIEAHAAGTPVGDSTEFQAIQEVYQQHFTDDRKLIIGAVKSQVGHFIAASGLVSLLKIIASLKHQSIPKNHHFKKAHPKIDVTTIPAVFPMQPHPWKKNKAHKRYAILNNFGFTGTISSAVIEEPPESILIDEVTSAEKCLFVLSAHTRTALNHSIDAYIDFLKRTNERLDNICYSTQTCRDHYRLRLAIIATDKQTLISALQNKDFEFTLQIPQKELVDPSACLENLKKDFLTGKNINFNALYHHKSHQKVSLPFYNFDREPYWHETQETKTLENKHIENEPIAIIGMSCRFPLANNIDEFYKLLEEGIDAFKPIPAERWDNQKFYNETPGEILTHPIKEMAFIDDVKSFDPHFFGISPREAKFLDPQQRLFLENCYLALEDANIASDTLKGSSTGVFAGVGGIDYYLDGIRAKQAKRETASYSISGISPYFTPARVSYTFDLRGPCKPVSAACASSLLAIHEACQSLKSHECHLALAGGTHLTLSPETTLKLSSLNTLSPEGRCKTFDKEADGFAKGEGCGAVILKRLSDAERDNDNILAIISSSATNNDGRSDGMLHPNIDAQKAIIKKVLNQSSIEEQDIQYIEAHGTATKVGDPIEIESINANFKQNRSKENPLYIASVKTNIGHLEASAGIASVIKTLLSLKYKTIFKHQNFKVLNPSIDLESLTIPLKSTPWHALNNTRSALINGFGFSGTNVAMLLQEVPTSPKKYNVPNNQPHLLCLSAKSKKSLSGLINKYIDYLSNTSNSFHDICYTAALHRNHYPYRVAIKANNVAQAIQTLETQPTDISPNKNVVKTLLTSPKHLDEISAHYLSGGSINWHPFIKRHNIQYNKVDIPTYVFDKQNYWLINENLDSTKNLNNLYLPILGSGHFLPGNRYLFNSDVHYDEILNSGRSLFQKKLIYPLSGRIKGIQLFVKKILRRKDNFELEDFQAIFPFICEEGSCYETHFKLQSPNQFAISFHTEGKTDWHQQSSMSLIFKKEKMPAKSSHLDSIKELAIHFENQALSETQLKLLQDQNQYLLKTYSPFSAVYLKDNMLWCKFKNKALNLPFDDALQLSELLFSQNSLTSRYYVSSIKKMTLQCEHKDIHSVLIERVTHKSSYQFNFLFLDEQDQLLSSFEHVTLSPLSLRDNFYLSYKEDTIYQSIWEKSPNIASASHHFQTIHPNPSTLSIASNNIHIYSSIEHIENLSEKNLLYFFDENNFQDFITLTQKLIKLPPKKVILITRQAYQLMENETVNPHHTMASSYWKTFSIEAGGTDVHQIDFESNMSTKDIVDLVTHHSLAEPQYLFRKQFYITKLIPYETRYPHALDYRLGLPLIEMRTDEKPCFLITGATGDLGQLLIQYLVSKGIRLFYTLSRRRPSPSFKQLVNSLKKKHITIIHHRINVSDERNMRGLFSSIEKKGHQLKGVFHLAGITNDAMILNIREKQLSQVIQTKAKGAWLLHKLTTHLELDHFVLFSSTAATFGASGQASYGAANGFLDGLSHLRSSLALPSLTINWGPWSELGMAKGFGAHHKRLSNILLTPKNIYLLDCLLFDKTTQVICNKFDWPKLFAAKGCPSIFSRIHHVQKTSISEHGFNHLENKKDIIQLVINTVCRILDIKDPDSLIHSETLYNYGLDSLLSFEIRNQLNVQLKSSNIYLPIENFIIAPSVESITTLIYKKNNTNRTEPSPSSSSSTSTLPSSTVALSYAQLFLWIHVHFGYDNLNMATRYCIRGHLNIDHLQRAFNHVIKHHAAFSILIDPNSLAQCLIKQPEVAIQYIDLQCSTHIDQDLTNAFYAELLKPYQWDPQNNIRLYLYQSAPDQHELHIYIPHIIGDGVCFDVLYNEVAQNYQSLIKQNTLLPMKNENGFFKFVEQFNDTLEKQNREKKIFWKTYNHKPFYFYPSMYNKNILADNDYLSHFLLNKEVITQALTQLKASHFNIQYGLTSILYMALQTVRRHDAISISVTENMRSKQHENDFGLFLHTKKFILSEKNIHSFIKVLDHTEQEALKTAEFQLAPRFSIEQFPSTFFRRLLYPVLFVYTKYFKLPIIKKLKIPPSYRKTILDYAIGIEYIVLKARIKIWLNKHFKTSFSLTKANGLNISLNIYRSFIHNDIYQETFPELHISDPHHLSSLDRFLSKNNLFVFLASDSEGNYVFSLNGPITHQAKKELVESFEDQLRLMIEQTKEAAKTLY